MLNIFTQAKQCLTLHCVRVRAHAFFAVGNQTPTPASSNALLYQ